MNYIDYSEQIKEFYNTFNINIDVTNIIDSYSITRYFIKLDRANKTRIANIEKLVDDLAVELGVKNIKFTLDFETGGIVLEVPKKNRQILNFENIKEETKKGLQVCFGKDLNNNNFIVDLCSTPHLLIAGTTGSGKSVFINTILLNLIQNYSTRSLKISLIDPKKVELSLYKNEKHVEAFADNLQDAKRILEKALADIDYRYKLLEHNNCRNLENYNKKTGEKLPYKLIIIDELADIIIQDKKNNIRNNDKFSEMTLENLIVRIAQIGRACGVHLIVATQRPSSDVITGLIKANIPSRVAFSVSSKIDSRIILDEKGAEKLTGKGDMFVKLVGDEELHRVQGAFVSDEEVENIVEQYKNYEKVEEQKQVQEVLNTISNETEPMKEYYNTSTNKETKQLETSLKTPNQQKEQTTQSKNIFDTLTIFSLVIAIISFIIFIIMLLSGTFKNVVLGFLVFLPISIFSFCMVCYFPNKSKEYNQTHAQKSKEEKELKRQQIIQVLKHTALCILAVIFAPISIILAIIAGTAKHYK